jgi:protein-tyrosine phosphatase
MMPPLIGDLAFRSITGLIKLLNPEIPIGIHLCLGDLNNESLAKLSTLKKLVNFSNKLVKRIPSNHKLDFIHYPLAEGNTPPVTDAAFYEVLRKINLPQGARFIAGFVHEKLSMEEHRHLLKSIENIRGERVDIACSCGMGRRTTETADHLFKIKKELVITE